MSQTSKIRKSRTQWKKKATQRGTTIWYQNKELKRVKRERDGIKKALNETNARLSQMEAQNQALAVQNKVDLVFLALQLFLVARIGFRAVSRVLGVLSEVLGIRKVPCTQTIINWVTRLSLVRIQSASMLTGVPLGQVPSSNGLILMIDTSIALGTGKILAILAIDANHHQIVPSAPGFQHVHCLAVSVAASWTGETIADFLQRLIAVLGRPAAYLKDGGCDLQKAIRILAERGLASPSIDDISHMVANLLKREYHEDPMFATFLSACGRVSANLKQTVLACLAPPKVQTKARFMNVHRLITWADRLFKLSPVGGAAKGSILSKLRASLDQLPSCKAFVKRFRDDAVPLLECQKILKTQGLSHDTLALCEQFINTIHTATVRHDFVAYLQGQLETATALGLDRVGLPICSDQIESLFGLAKQHGAGEFKDAGRIAIRLPALCGAPSRAEAEQVLEVSVAEQNEFTGGIPSLIKQRREVLPHPHRLETLGEKPLQAPIELLPRVKNQSKKQEKLNISTGCKESPGPDMRPNPPLTWGAIVDRVHTHAELIPSFNPG